MITGIDVSHKNGQINWKILADSNIHFVFIQASEAIDSIDPYFIKNLEGAKNAGLLVGAYHWLHPRLHVGQQAELFLNTIKGIKKMLPAVVCLEKHRAPVSEIEKNVRSYLTLIERKTGEKPIIYTTEEYWQQNFAESDWGCDYPLWFDKPGLVTPPQLYPWASWTFWQQSYQERLPGINTDCGINWFNGSLNELNKMVIN